MYDRTDVIILTFLFLLLSVPFLTGAGILTNFIFKYSKDKTTKLKKSELSLIKVSLIYVWITISHLIYITGRNRNVAGPTWIADYFGLMIQFNQSIEMQRITVLFIIFLIVGFGYISKFIFSYNEDKEVSDGEITLMKISLLFWWFSIPIIASIKYLF